MAAGTTSRRCERLLGRAAAHLLPLAAAGLMANPAHAQDFIIGSAQAAVNPNTVKEGLARHFAIAPQSLETALDAFTSETGIQVFYNSQLTTGHRSPGVNGLYSVEAALHALLAGTQLAAIPTARDAITLALSADNATLSAVPPAHAPMMSLAPLQVEIPAVRGYQAYAATVQYAVQIALRRDNELRQRHYSTAINVWVTTAGMVQASQILSSTGDQMLDGTINHVVQGVAVPAPPPSNLPQPVHIRILARGN